jgi:hypothetical protein
MTTRPLWFRLDCDIADDPALAYLHEEGRHGAVWLYIRGLAYASRHLTDGFVPRNLPRQWGFKPRDVEQLTNLGLWNEYQEAAGMPGGYIITGYLNSQPSREQWERAIAQRRNAALARWGKRSA